MTVFQLSTLPTPPRRPGGARRPCPLLWLAAWLLFAAGGVAQESATLLVSRADGVDGIKGNRYSNVPAISAGGRYVAFYSESENLHPDDTDAIPDVFLRDVETDETTLLSRAGGAGGEKGDSPSLSPAISTDGQRVVFRSYAGNLHPDDTDGENPLQDVYVRDLETHQTILVSRASGSDGAKGNDHSGFNLPKISGDGRYVAFSSFANNLHPDDADDTGDVFVRDLETDQTILVSRASGGDGVKGNGWSSLPSISSDGRYVVFFSFATNLHPDDTDDIGDVFRRDLETGETVLISRASGIDGAKGNGESAQTSISADGRYVAFDSFATNLHPDDTDDNADIYVRDLQTHELRLSSRASGSTGDKGNSGSVRPSISADGVYVAFYSSATNLHPDDTDFAGDGVDDVFVRNLQTHETLLISRASGADGAKGNRISRDPSISADGRFVAFSSFATNLHLDDTDDVEDIFLRDALASAEQPELTFDPPSLDFGEVEIGATGPPQTAMLENTGDATATGLELNPAGAGFEADTDNCGDTLEAGESCLVSVTFTPIELGPASSTVEVISEEGASTELGLTGSGVSLEIVTPVALAVDLDPLLSDGNKIFEPGELIEVAPAWRNDGLFETSLTGTASSFGGAPGALYLLPLDDADYGNVDSGATAGCRDTGVCYWLGVDDPAVRPATHWESAFDETLSDDTTKAWSLHVGDSFTDVPRTSPFYAAIETLLHHGVTGGCTGSEYCPSGLNTRAQMAVFLLKAAEGGDYEPPACLEGDEPFADVPFDSALCPWIAELAGRGATSGCGDGNYCPAEPVTRGQMAVFLLKAFEGGDYAPPECMGGFTDVTCPSAFADWIEELAERGVTGGCGTDPPTYCPEALVTRQQMAVFVTEIFGFTLYGP